MYVSMCDEYSRLSTFIEHCSISAFGSILTSPFADIVIEFRINVGCVYLPLPRSRNLLETLPEIPELPKVELPPLPDIPTLPKPELPTLPTPQLPELPKPEVPELPHLPNLPDLPKPTLPELPHSTTP
ncbi:hypothetical protein RJ641_013347 [Dillenia turbinata]|uniref:Uncharacterized protein n=1 Tax=Dillenia turbinata TaxID=194707 RepID=A0AAN8W3T6_9MAGN